MTTEEASTHLLQGEDATAMTTTNNRHDDNMFSQQQQQQSEQQNFNNTTATTALNIGGVNTNNFVDKLMKYQRVALITSHLFALVGIIFCIIWIHQLGGLSSSLSHASNGNAKLVFNWHPLCMTIAFFFMTVANLAFRLHISRNRACRKVLHAISWTVGLCAMLSGIVAVFTSHNDVTSGLIANMYSLHSWMGMTILVLYTLQWIVGLLSFGDVWWNRGGIVSRLLLCRRRQQQQQRHHSTSTTSAWKPLIMILHKLLGPWIYQGMAVTILLGIQEKEGFVGCSYKVNSIDWWGPIGHVHEFPLPCRISHGMGIFILLTALSTSFAVTDFNIHRQNNNNNNDDDVVNALLQEQPLVQDHHVL